MHPAQVLDLQSDLIARCTVPGFRELVRATIEEDFADNGERDAKYLSHARRQSEEFSERLMYVLGRAHAYYCDPSMMDLLTWASASLDGTDKFRFDEVPTEEGFVYFPSPIRMNDIRGKSLLVHAVVWTPIVVMIEGVRQGMGYLFYSFNDYRNEPDDIGKRILESYPNDIARFGKWGFVGVFSLTDEQRIGPVEIGITDTERERIIAEGDTPHEFTNIARIIHTYFLMLNQTITDVSEAEIGRTFAKRAKRAGIPPRVTVIRMRRVERDNHVGESSVEWQHQWIVRGHWRWQHVSEHHPLAEPDGDGFRARVWVRPHIKGPEDKPLHVTEKVIALMR